MDSLKDVTAWAKTIEEQVAKHMIGQKELIENTMIGMLAGGHVLIEGVPGLGKTRLVHVLGQVLGLNFKRIQFTPDLMPADITGTLVYRQDQGTFVFQQGPVFTNILLADEINRATPKTQSALLEAMQEHTVTIGGQSYALPKPYMVMATQNPIEQEGTYPLPEAQLDRFMFKLLVPFPSVEELTAIVTMTSVDEAIDFKPITNGEALTQVQTHMRSILIADPVMAYAMKLVAATHPNDTQAPEVIKHYVAYGASPRAAISLIQGARVRALLKGRFNVSFEDINVLAYPVLRHRLGLNFDAVTDNKTPDAVIEHLIEAVKP